MIFCLLTFEMPGMGGHELFDRLKEIDSKVKEIIYLYKSNKL
jgi:CheY-like chemotaxis protein